MDQKSNRPTTKITYVLFYFLQDCDSERFHYRVFCSPQIREPVAIQRMDGMQEMFQFINVPDEYDGPNLELDKETAETWEFVKSLTMDMFKGLEFDAVCFQWSKGKYDTDTDADDEGK